MSVAETTALQRAAELTGAKGMVGWNRRFHPIIVEAKRQVTARGARHTNRRGIPQEYYPTDRQISRTLDGQYVSGDTDPRP